MGHFKSLISSYQKWFIAVFHTLVDATFQTLAGITVFLSKAFCFQCFKQVNRTCYAFAFLSFECSFKSWPELQIMKSVHVQLITVSKKIGFSQVFSTLGFVWCHREQIFLMWLSQKAPPTCCSNCFFNNEELIRRKLAEGGKKPIRQFQRMRGCRAAIQSWFTALQSYSSPRMKIWFWKWAE